MNEKNRILGERPEAGNKKHIEELKRLKDEKDCVSIPINIEFSVLLEAKFKCNKCDEDINFVYEDDYYTEGEDPYSCAEGEEIKCVACDEKFVVNNGYIVTKKQDDKLLEKEFESIVYKNQTKLNL